jgi:hypothetical protein
MNELNFSCYYGFKKTIGKNTKDGVSKLEPDSKKYDQADFCLKSTFKIRPAIIKKIPKIFQSV